MRTDAFKLSRRTTIGKQKCAKMEYGGKKTVFKGQKVKKLTIYHTYLSFTHTFIYFLSFFFCSTAV
jgi:hypothetical protein